MIDVMAAKNIPIKTLDKSSGLLVAEVANVPIPVGGKPSPWADCGKSLGHYLSPNRADYNFRVKPASGGSTVQATVRWENVLSTATLGSRAVECTTKGVWESEAEADIKQRAESH